jgi:LPS export ABC transporter protein LptC
LEYDYQNGDREFPKGLYLEFYDKDKNILSTLRTDYCYYQLEEDVYKATGNVEIYGKDKNQKLNTEELFWNRKEERVYTDKFVRIEKEGEILTGTGLDANQDFSEYTINKPEGNFDMEENEEESSDD